MRAAHLIPFLTPDGPCLETNGLPFTCEMVSPFRRHGNLQAGPCVGAFAFRALDCHPGGAGSNNGTIPIVETPTIQTQVSHRIEVAAILARIQAPKL